jgi:hypothetical protein
MVFRNREQWRKKKKEKIKKWNGFNDKRRIGVMIRC